MRIDVCNGAIAALTIVTSCLSPLLLSTNFLWSSTVHSPGVLRFPIHHPIKPRRHQILLAVHAINAHALQWQLFDQDSGRVVSFVHQHS